MDLRGSLHVINARKWPLIAIVAVVFTVALTASLLTPRAYRGEVSILLNETGNAPEADTGLPSSSWARHRSDMQTQMRLMRRRPLIESTIATLGLKASPDEVLQRVTISPDGQTRLVTLSVTDSTPQRAAATANALANAYVSWSRGLDRSRVASVAQEVGARLAAAQAEIVDLGSKMNGGDSTDLQAQLADAVSQQQNLLDTLIDLRVNEQAQTNPSALASTRARIASAERQFADVKARILELGSRLGSLGDASGNKGLLAQMQVATDRSSTLAKEYEALELARQLAVGSGSVDTPAVADFAAVSPDPLRDGALGLALGLVLGLGVVFTAEHFDTSIRSAGEAEEIFRTPVLARIPAEPVEWDGKRRLASVERPDSRAAEAYRGLRDKVDLVNFQHDIKTVLVASAEPGEGKSTVAANLAAALAMRGSRVVLLDCDFRGLGADRFFNVDNHIGLTDVLNGRVSLGAALQVTHDGKLTVLTPGSAPPNPSELLGSQPMAELVEALAAAHDWLIVDSPPLSAVAEATGTMRWIDGVLVVSQPTVSTAPAALSARGVLDKTGARVMGIVVWGLDDDGDGGRPGGERGDPGSGTMGDTAPIDQPSGEFQMPEERVPNRLVVWLAGWRSRLPAPWITGWRLWLLILVAVLIVVSVLLLDWWLGWGFLGIRAAVLR